MDNVNKTIKIYFADTEGEELDKLASYFEAKGDKYEIVGKGSDGMVVAGEVLSTKPDFLVTEVLLAGADCFKASRRRVSKPTTTVTYFLQPHLLIVPFPGPSIFK